MSKKRNARKTSSKWKQNENSIQIDGKYITAVCTIAVEFTHLSGAVFKYLRTFGPPVMEYFSMEILCTVSWKKWKQFHAWILANYNLLIFFLPLHNLNFSALIVIAISHKCRQIKAKRPPLPHCADFLILNHTQSYRCDNKQQMFYVHPVESIINYPFAQYRYNLQ